MEEQKRKEIREEKLRNFNENENGLRDHGIFGLPFDVAESELVIVPLPWEATVSYATGTVEGSDAVLEASQQIDLYDPLCPTAWREGVAILQKDVNIEKSNIETRAKVDDYLTKYTEGKIDNELLSQINKSCEDFKSKVKAITTDLLNQGKFVGLLGGDHSTPLGYMEALAEKHKNFGILHIDAHADLREAYEGFTYSHASIFYNALKIKQVDKLVQVGIRDFSKSEQDLVDREDGRVKMFTEYELRKALFTGSTWGKVCENIVNELPEKVYISFDIDGLSPYLSPNTGTPVVGGFSLDEIIFLFEKVLQSGKQIIGFDLSEVAPGEDEWDGNVGARVLYKLCLLSLKNKVNV